MARLRHLMTDRNRAESSRRWSGESATVGGRGAAAGQQYVESSNSSLRGSFQVVHLDSIIHVVQEPFIQNIRENCGSFVSKARRIAPRHFAWSHWNETASKGAMNSITKHNRLDAS